MKQVKPGVWATKSMAKSALNQQPFTAACRARHEVVPVYETNLLGERTSQWPLGWGYRLASKK